MPDETKMIKNGKEILEHIKDKFYDRFSGVQKIRINWNQGGITEVKEVVEKKIK